MLRYSLDVIRLIKEFGQERKKYIYIYIYFFFLTRFDDMFYQGTLLFNDPRRGKDKR